MGEKGILKLPTSKKLICGFYLIEFVLGIGFLDLGTLFITEMSSRQIVPLISMK